MELLKNASVTVDDNKCEFLKSRIRFLGHIVSSQVIASDPEKLCAIAHMLASVDVSGIRQS